MHSTALHLGYMHIALKGRGLEILEICSEKNSKDIKYRMVKIRNLLVSKIKLCKQ